ncbi:hypothetical protein NDU88_003901 [Pleurodeles waltl]|uniref:Uncharacterized protein n=1 Tax=Pleurodeles waltl TaxID=8319 RepID=A0AAV7T6T2_PLEWA|nr:hypothetical protein NDU88_003901 [Pleurodeles waltl]
MPAHHGRSDLTTTGRRCRGGGPDKRLRGGARGLEMAGIADRVETHCRPEPLGTGRVPSLASEVHALTPPGIMADPAQGATMDHILQEISEVGRRLEGMDNGMASLTAETKSMWLDIAGFQSQVLGLEQQVSTVETHITSLTDWDQELLYLRSKLINLEDRSCRDNFHFLGFPETIEGADIHSYLRETLPKLTGLTFDPPPWNFRGCTGLVLKGKMTPIVPTSS